MSDLKIIPCADPARVILACACGRRVFADSGARKYVCENCGAVEVLGGARVAAKAAEPELVPEAAEEQVAAEPTDEEAAEEEEEPASAPERGQRTHFGKPGRRR